jgi:hypothetical protein
MKTPFIILSLLLLACCGKPETFDYKKCTGSEMNMVKKSASSQDGKHLEYVAYHKFGCKL